LAQRGLDAQSSRPALQAWRRPTFALAVALLMLTVAMTVLALQANPTILYQHHL
jgi:hypothetical protein